MAKVARLVRATRSRTPTFPNPRMDELLRMGRAELSPDKRKAIYMEIAQLVIQEVPAIRQ